MIQQEGAKSIGENFNIEQSVKVMYVECQKQGMHFGEVCNMVCLEPSCVEDLICCCACIEESHKKHL